MSTTITLFNQPLVVTGKGQAQFTPKADPRLKAKRVAFTSDKFGAFQVGEPVVADFEYDVLTANRKMLGAPRPMTLTSSLHEEILESKPSRITGFFVSEEMRMAYTTAKQMSGFGRTVKIMMIGPSGYGKTSIPKVFAAAVGADFYRMNCAAVRDPEEWFGYREAQKGSTVFVKSDLMKRLETGNVVVVLDEFNRVEPWLHNSLFPLLDDDGATVIHDEIFTLGPNVYVVATINQGFQYTGTFELDEAMMNRFDIVLEVGPLPADEEIKVLMDRTGVDKDKAKTIVTTANDLRSIHIVCSTRSTILVASMVAAGMTVREAFENGVVRRIMEDGAIGGGRKAAIDSINATLGPVKRRALAIDVFSSILGEEETTTIVPVDGMLRVSIRVIKGMAETANRIGAIKETRKHMDVSLHDAKRLIESATESVQHIVEVGAFDQETLAAKLKEYGYTLEVK